MRLKIELQSKTEQITLPLNYQYPLSSAIYKIFDAASKEFSEFLHDVGFFMSNGKPTKFFCFSKLFFPSFSIDKEKNQLHASDKAYFYFSTPLIDTLAQKFVEGIMQTEEIFIGNSSAGTKFGISAVEVLKEYSFTGEDGFDLISPVSVSTTITQNDKRKVYYYRPEDSMFFTAMEHNLRGKFEYLTGRPYKGKLEIIPDYGDYIPKYHSKLITIKEGSGDETRVKAFHLPIRIFGSRDIIEVAYETGLGERNSLGFGMLYGAIS